MSDDKKFDGREQLNLILNVISLVDGNHRILNIAEKLDVPFRKFEK